MRLLLCFGGFMNVRRQFSVIGWALTAFYLVSAGAQFLFGVFLNGFGYLLPRFVWSDDFLMIASQVIMYGIAFPVFFAIIKRLPSWFMAEKKEITSGKLTVIFIICIGASYVGNLMGIMLMMASDLMLGTQSMNPVTDMLGNMSPEIMIFSTVVAAPFMEELMFRKLLIDRLIPLGQKTAVLVSGLAFGLFHGNFYQFFYAFILGMIFAYVYSQTGKLRYNVMLHMGINLVGGVLPFLLEKWTAQSILLSWLSTLLMWGFIFLMIIVSMILTAIFGGKVQWFPAWERTEKGLGYAIFTASGVWAFLLVSALEFVMIL